MSDAQSSVESLRRAAEARAEHRRLGTQLGEAQRLAEERATDLADLETRLRAEEADVRRIEGMSPSRLWATLRGDVDDRVARERAERDAAVHAVASARTRAEQADADVARLEQRRAAFGDVEARYATALTAVERTLADDSTTSASDLRIIAADLGEASAQDREIGEAVAALRLAVVALEEAFSHLESAGGWSTYDTFFGGGVIADMMKHSRLDESARAFERVNRALERLRVELADIGGGPVQPVQVSDSLAVFDVLFDNVFADWIVRERIARAREEALDLRVRLSELDRTLAERRLALAQHVSGLTRRREQLLLDAG